MNAVVTEDEDVSTAVEGPGKRLKAIRESKGLDVSSVASMLHLSEGKLEALERDDYDSLAGSVFVQGYLRNYARLLDVPTDTVLEAYHQINPATDRHLDLKVGYVRKEVHSSHGLVRMFTWLIVLGLIGLVLTWWQGYLQWPLKTEAASDEVVSVEEAEDKPLGDLPMSGESSLPIVDSDDGTLSLPVFASSENPDTEINLPVEEMAVEEASAEAPVVNDEQTPPEVSTALSGDQAASESVNPVVDEPMAIEQPSTAISKSVELIFGGECWINVKDASGAYKLTGTQRSGSRQTLGGSAPYNMVLGNASAVTMLVGGEAFDLTPYTSGNVAKFTLELD